MAALFLSTGARIASDRGQLPLDTPALLLAAGLGRLCLLLLLPGHRFPTLCNRIQDPPVVLEPLLFGASFG